MPLKLFYHTCSPALKQKDVCLASLIHRFSCFVAFCDNVCSSSFMFSPTGHTPYIPNIHGKALEGGSRTSSTTGHHQHPRQWKGEGCVMLHHCCRLRLTSQHTQNLILHSCHFGHHCILVSMWLLYIHICNKRILLEVYSKYFFFVKEMDGQVSLLILL